MLTNDTMIKCGWCGESEQADVWNAETKKECYTREMKRAYVDIFNEKVFKREAKVSWYKCPKCSMWNKGSNLRITGTTDEKLLRLGGEPVVKSVKERY